MATTYEQWLETQRKANQRIYDDSVAAASTALSEAKATADSAFEKAQPTYGMLGEQMAQLGLTGGGYADNLVRDAYAARQSGYDAAHKVYSDALRDAEQTKAANDLTIDQAAYEHQQEINTNFAADYEYIEKGKVSRQSLINSIVAGGYSKQQADLMFQKAGLTVLTDGEYNALLGITGGGTADGTIGGGGQNQTAISPALTEDFGVLRGNENGAVTKEWMQAFIDKLNTQGTAYDKTQFENYLLSAPTKDGMAIGGYDTAAAYYASLGMGDLLEGMFPGITTKKPKQTEQPTNDAYTLSGSGFKIRSRPTLKEGKNFKVENGSETYKVQLGKKVDVNSVEGLAEAAANAGDETLFYYNGGIYAKFVENGNPEIWSVERRKYAWFGQSSSYDDFADDIHSAAGGDLTQVKYTIDNENDEDLSDDGNNIMLRDSLGRKYKVQMGGEATDAGIREAAKSLGDNAVFEYMDDIYIRNNEGDGYKVYRIEKRPMGGHFYKQLIDNIGKYNTETQKTDIDAAAEGAQNGVKMIDAKVSGAGRFLGLFDNFTAKIGDTEYKVETDKRASSEVENLAKEAGVKKDSLFTYGGKMYVRHGDKCLEVKARPFAKSGQYAKLLNALPEDSGVGRYSIAFDQSKGEKPDDGMEEGDDLSFVDAGGVEYKVESAGEASGVTPPESIGDLVPFLLNDEVYVKYKNKVYKLRKRNLFRTNAYQSLIDKMKASQS